MSTSEFEAFTEAMARRPAPPAPDAPAFDRVTVLGGGPEGRLLASLCLAEGAEVTLFSAYGAELAAIRSTGGVTLRGAGPVGTFPAGREDGPSIRLSAELDAALAGAALVFVTGPVLKQRTYAMVLAEHVADGQVLALVPGRSLGALEAAWYLRVGGCEADVVLAEVQALPYWIREDGATLHLTRARPAPAAALPSDRTDVVRGLARFLPGLVPVRSVAESGFADGSGLVEVPALLLGGPAVPPGGGALPPGAEPLPERDTFRALVGDRHLAVVEAMARERRQVAARFGVRDLPDTGEWIDAFAGARAGDEARPVPDAAHARRLVRCAAVGSLTPLVSAAEAAEIDAPVTRAMRTLAETLLGTDLVHAGRRLDTVGIGAGDLDDARRAMDAIARGGR